ncbi:hypothetical protein JVX90_13780 [Gordonia sp. PDNC005]|uniref:hypothetical protein n=1 Tax=Gordonia sp. PDNC005 TaxID=2811424 RepID=UPI001962EDC6|nr:hypothetical protein [Gordonia sp. PDNC005]QRY61482.1 hypothetical protein JVX90_13780 [Gordonia sp. PDNC005]
MTAVRTWTDTVPTGRAAVIGWEFAQFCTDWLLQPDGPDAGQPLRLTREQLRIGLRWYEVDERDRFVNRRGVLRRMKGWGKDPFSVALIWFEALGRCRLVNGVLTQHPAPWIQVAAVSREQTRNTMTLLGPMLSKDAVAEFNVDLGKEITYVRGTGRIEAVTSSPRALEGGRPSFCLMNETQHWIDANQGIEMARVVTRNLGKSRDGAARALAIQNAHVPGEGSVAELDYDAWQAISTGRSAAALYYDATEAPTSTEMADRESLRAGLVAARGDSVWLDIDRLVEEILDPATPVEMSRRFYLNQVVAASDALLTPIEWDRLADLGGRRLTPGDTIVLGFDGGKTDDATALIAMRVEDRLIQPIGIWQAPDGPAGRDWEVDRTEVDGVVRNTLEQYDVVAFFADVALWESYIDAWSIDYRDQLAVKASTRSAIGWDMRGGKRDLTLANESLLASVLDERVKVASGTPLDRLLRTHVLNARRRLNSFGLSFGKEHRESARKVDGWAALLLADMARAKFQESGKRSKPRTGEAFFF